MLSARVVLLVFFPAAAVANNCNMVELAFKNCEQQIDHLRVDQRAFNAQATVDYFCGNYEPIATCYADARSEYDGAEGECGAVNKWEVMWPMVQRACARKQDTVTAYECMQTLANDPSRPMEECFDHQLGAAQLCGGDQSVFEEVQKCFHEKMGESCGEDVANAAKELSGEQTTETRMALCSAFGGAK